MNYHTNNSDEIRPMLRAIEARIQDARDRRTGEKKLQGMPLFAPPIQHAATDHGQAGTEPASVDPNAPLKAKRKSASSFTTPMPTRNIWDRRVG
jgi:hypothetical protein